MLTLLHQAAAVALHDVHLLHRGHICPSADLLLGLQRIAVPRRAPGVLTVELLEVGGELDPRRGGRFLLRGFLNLRPVLR